MKVAQGITPADLAIVNARVVNVYTAEVLENQSLCVSGDWIAYVGPDPGKMIGHTTRVIDAADKYVIPGFIDGHTHLAWLFSISEFLKYAIPGGTTTIITETLEPYPVCGLNGVIDFLNSLQNQPIKLFATAPGMVSISRMTSGIAPQDLAVLLKRDDILGLGETYWQGVLQAPEIYLPQFEQTLAAGKTIEGHSAGARDRKLAAYVSAGASSCHEPITPEEALDRLRAGMYVMVREGSIRRDLEAVSTIKDAAVDLRRLILSTDGISPGELMGKGYMDYVVQQAIHYGFKPIQAIQMATLNVAEHFHIDHLVGGLSPGKYADMLILPDLRTITPELVVSNGRVISENGRALVAPRVHEYEAAHRKSIRLPHKPDAADFSIDARIETGRARVRTIKMISDLVTAEDIIEIPVADGKLQIESVADVQWITCVDRTHKPGKLFTGLIRGFGLKSGAVACSAAWDCSDIIVIGTTGADMAAAVNRIHHLQGGAVICDGGRTIAEIPLPIFGLMTDAPMPEIAHDMELINTKARERGVPFTDPMLTLITLTGAAIPYLKICEEGLVNLKDGQHKPLIAGYGA